MAITPDDLVRREVGHCVSSLVETIASAYGMSQSAVDAEPHLWALINQAAELTYPLDDYEGAAEEMGWTPTIIGDPKAQWQLMGSENGKAVVVELANSAQEACEAFDIQPFIREVFEHWIVSDWLADKLEAKGEKVDRDFAGLIIWARTTTGQAISQDWVIEQIAKDLNAA